MAWLYSCRFWKDNMDEREKYLQPWVNISLTFNLIVCRKKQRIPGRISLLKRKAQHRRKRLQRKKHAKFKRWEPGSQHRDSFFPATFGLHRADVVVVCSRLWRDKCHQQAKQYLGNYVTGRNATIELLLRVYPERSRRALLYANNSSSNN